MLIQTILCPNNTSIFYDLWQNSENWVHLGIYFNMKADKFVYINAFSKKLEIVDFRADDEPTGFGNKYTNALKDKIKHIRTKVRYY